MPTNATIRKVTRYSIQTPTGSKEFETVSKAKDFVEGEIERFFQPLFNSMEFPAKHRIGFIEAVLKNREYLAHWLAYEIDLEDDD
jgi:hypothetical protein